MAFKYTYEIKDSNSVITCRKKLLFTRYTYLITESQKLFDSKKFKNKVQLQISNDKYKQIFWFSTIKEAEDKVDSIVNQERLTHYERSTGHSPIAERFRTT